MHLRWCQRDDQHYKWEKSIWFQPGRNINSFPFISTSPLDQLDVFALHAWLTRHKKRLAANPYSCDYSCCKDDDQESTDEEEEEEAIIVDDGNDL